MKDTILAQGLKPMTRRYVHLSKTKREAFEVARRKSKIPTIFVVKAREAHKEGMEFYDIGAVVLTEALPAEFIQLAQES
jgi:putative RNA 2'-phosphotransferase